MTSTRKITANRANSQSSTGPKSREGKPRSAQNVRRHGLSLPVSLNPALSQEAEALVREISGSSEISEVLEAARIFAEAQIGLERLTRVRYEYLQRLQGQFDEPVEASGSNALEEAVRDNSRRQEPSQAARRHILDQLLKIDRHEQRALSRRKYGARMLNISLKAAKRRRDMEMYSLEELKHN